LPTTPERIRHVLARVQVLLLEKNAAYGDSALEPVRIFSKADPLEQLRVRIDDKLSRVVRGGSEADDVLIDLVGYLVLLLVAHQGAERAS